MFEIINMKEQILKLREEGKTYNEIQKITGASKGTISYHCGEGQKDKTTNRRRKIRKENPFLTKLNVFKGRVRDFQRNRNSGGSLGEGREYNFSLQDVVKKLSLTPKCYLTGKEIDIYDTKSYHFDHIVPVTKGGEYSIDNLQICTKECNIAKSNLSKEELFKLCIDILTYNGYDVIKKGK